MKMGEDVTCDVTCDGGASRANWSFAASSCEPLDFDLENILVPILRIYNISTKKFCNKF
jgi:hypothetical protein